MAVAIGQALGTQQASLKRLGNEKYIHWPLPQVPDTEGPNPAIFSERWGDTSVLHRAAK